MLHQVTRAHLKQNHLKALFYNGMPKIFLLPLAKQTKPPLLRDKHTITYKPYVPKVYKDHDYKNMALGRPMSPHLTVYGMTVPAGTSIFQRITGIILAGFGLTIAGAALFLPNGIESIVAMIHCLGLNRFSVFFLKLLLGLPFAFHYSNGIRFCIWNAARMFSKKDVQTSATKVYIATAAIAVLFAFF